MADTFGVELGKTMVAQRVSFRELARRTGLSAGYLNQLANGRRRPPADRELERIADALELEPTAFFEYRRRRAVEAIDENERLVDRLIGRR